MAIEKFKYRETVSSKRMNDMVDVINELDASLQTQNIAINGMMHSLRLHYDQLLSKFWISLLDSDGKKISDTGVVEFATNNAISDISFDSATKELIFTLSNNVEKKVSISSMFSGFTDEIANLQSQIDALAGNEGSEEAETPEIDSSEEVKNFLNGITNDKTLQDVIDENTQTATTEDVLSLFNNQ